MHRDAIRPLVGIIANYGSDEYPRHLVGNNNVLAVARATSGVPVALPALGDAFGAEGWLDHLDGVVLTGGAANVEPHRYDQAVHPDDGSERDPMRDGTAIALAQGALRRGVPLLGICRGLQEMNVAFGGSLHTFLHDVPGRLDHRRDRSKVREVAMAPRHRLALTPGSLMAAIAGAEEVMVNSLHAQGIDRLADVLQVDGLAEDGTIEAVSAPTAPGFVLGVQWHCEWKPLETPLHKGVFAAFDVAIRAHVRRRQGLDAPETPARAAE